MKRLTRLGLAIVFLGLINFAAFGIDSLLLGGDAVHGKVENERYYVGNHGKYTEVPKIAWHYSAAHAASISATGTLTMLGGLVLLWCQQLARYSTRVSPSRQEEKQRDEKERGEVP